MNKKITVVLLLALGLSLAIAGIANAAVTTPGVGVARATASGDLIGDTVAELPYGAKVVGVKVNPSTAGKYYRLRVGSASGAILYETNSASTTATMALDRVEFKKPSSGLYFQTDDASPNLSIIIYTEQ